MSSFQIREGPQEFTTTFAERPSKNVHVLQLAVHVSVSGQSAPTFDQCRSPTQYYGGEQCASEVHVRLLDSVSEDLVDPRAFVSYQVRSEQQLWSAESGRTDLKRRSQFRFCVCEEYREIFKVCLKHVQTYLLGLHLKCFHQGEHTEPSLFLKSRPFAG